MSAAVGAALKKIAVALLTDKRVLKAVGMILLILAVILILPFAAIAAIFSGSIEVNVSDFQQRVEENLSAEDSALLQGTEDTMNAIDTALTNAGMPNRVGEAQVLYIMALGNYANQPDFVSRLVSCFQENQTDAQLVALVNQTFGTSIAVEDFTNAVQNIRTTYIDCSEYYDPTTKNNLDLVQWAIEAEEAGWGYVWGTYGYVLTQSYYEAKLEQYPDAIGEHAEFIQANWLGRRTADCVGLVKGYCWFDPEDQSIGYAINGMPDVATDAMITSCDESGTMDTMPEIPGLLLWMDGHVGIYIGDGYAIEAMGTRYGVVKTVVEGRGWLRWGKIPCIEYIEETEETEPTDATTETTAPAATTPSAYFFNKEVME